MNPMKKLSTILVAGLLTACGAHAGSPGPSVAGRSQGT